MTERDATASLAKELWSTPSMTLAPQEFQARFDALYSASSGIATYWQLGGAAVDYLRRYPNSLVVPPQLAMTLLDSRLVDGQIVGLKLLARHSSDTSIIAHWICIALESDHDGVLHGGLHELQTTIDRSLSFAPDALRELLKGLSALRPSNDLVVRVQAERLVERLKGCGARS